MKDKSLINENIRFDRMQVISFDGVNLGLITRFEALKLAQEAGVDLVLISDKGNEGYPVAKIMDFGKVLYSKKKKATEAKKKQKVIKVKEIKIRPKIGDHDLQIKLNQTLEFLKEGKRVKITLVFKGREVVNRNEAGRVLFEKVNEFFNSANLPNLESEKDVSMGQMWSRIYYLKGN